MKRLLLFGGTFDPPHLGHMGLLRAAIRAVRPDFVLVMPTGIPPHKAAGHTEAALRLRMCKCFLPLFQGMKISDLEIRRGGKSYTVDTVRTLCRRYPGVQIYLPMGSDMLLTFREWREWRALLRMTTLVVLCRDDAHERPVRAFAEELEKEGARILLARGPISEVSSTELRTAVRTGQNIHALVAPEAERVIRKHHLYQEQNIV